MRMRDQQATQSARAEELILEMSEPAATLRRVSTSDLEDFLVRRFWGASEVDEIPCVLP